MIPETDPNLNQNGSRNESGTDANSDPDSELDSTLDSGLDQNSYQNCIRMELRNESEFDSESYQRFIHLLMGNKGILYHNALISGSIWNPFMIPLCTLFFGFPMIQDISSDAF